jgi:hypothetical protein
MIYNVDIFMKEDFCAHKYLHTGLSLGISDGLFSESVSTNTLFEFPVSCNGAQNVNTSADVFLCVCTVCR